MTNPRPYGLLVVGLIAVVAVAATVVVLIVFNSGSSTTLGHGERLPGVTATGDGTLDQQQRHIADEIVSVFENGTSAIDYSYIKDLDDGRGYTAGRAGFCSGCGDMLEVVRRYAQTKPDSDLAGFVPALEEAAADGSGDTDNLDGLREAWRDAADDPDFRAAQDAMVDKLYFDPAADQARRNGVTTALGITTLYDTAIQHGPDGGPDSLAAIIDRTNQDMGGSPAAGVDQSGWLQDFLETRRDVLENPSTPDTAEVWGESTGRIDALEALLQEGNLTLSAPVVINPWGTPQTLS